MLSKQTHNIHTKQNQQSFIVGLLFLIRWRHSAAL